MEENKKFRVVKISSLGGSDMKIIVFVESNAENDPEIDKLIKCVDLLTYKSKGNGKVFDEQDILNLFKNPLAKYYGVGEYQGHHDHEGTYILRGKMRFPDGILDEESLPKE